MPANRLIQLRVPDRIFKDIQDLKETTGLKVSEIIRNGILLLVWAKEKQNQGYEIFAINKKKEGEYGDKVEILM